MLKAKSTYFVKINGSAQNPMSKPLFRHPQPSIIVEIRLSGQIQTKFRLILENSPNSDPFQKF